MVDSRLWQVCSPSGLLWKIWGDEQVVYNPFSGNTHLLDNNSANILKSLEVKRQAIDELAQDFIFSPDEAEVVSVSEIEKIILELQKSTLVEPCPL